MCNGVVTYPLLGVVTPGGEQHGGLQHTCCERETLTWLHAPRMMAAMREMFLVVCRYTKQSSGSSRIRKKLHDFAFAMQYGVLGVDSAK